MHSQVRPGRTIRTADRLSDPCYNVPTWTISKKLTGFYMTTIWEATCECGEKTRVELHGESGETVLKVGCEDHWVEIPTERLKAELAKTEAERN